MKKYYYRCIYYGMGEWVECKDITYYDTAVKIDLFDGSIMHVSIHNYDFLVKKEEE